MTAPFTLLVGIAASALVLVAVAIGDTIRASGSAAAGAAPDGG